jgi:Transposase DDE domain
MSIGVYDQREVLVLADSGYDNKKIEKAIADKGWHFISSTYKVRGRTVNQVNRLLAHF